MPIASATSIEKISQAKDPKAAILAAVGDISEFKIASDLVLLGTFIRNEKTIGGIILPTDNLKEDEFQGKVGLVLKRGPIAYSDWEQGDEIGQMARLHTWVVYQIKDAWPCQINGTACRMIAYDKIRAVTPRPAMVF